MHTLKNFLKKIIPKKIFDIYHFSLAWIASFVFRFPSKKMIIIGVTGTKGKTSTINYLWSVLEYGGIKTGVITTANVRIGETEILNPFHMTMPGRFVIQKFLHRMVSEGCRCAIVETTSQGIAQFRHIGIDYDVAIFTNLTPEHIDAHKTFENYKMMKGKLFETLSHSATKYFDNKPFPKTIIANADSEYAPFFLSFDAPRKEAFSMNLSGAYKADNVLFQKDGVSFEVGKEKYSLQIPGVFNVYNALPAIIIGHIFGISKEKIKRGLHHLSVIPGRMEEISLGQDFRLFVDYAHEKYSMTFVTETANLLKQKGAKSIILLGAEGGGRDKSKRAVMGEIVGKNADIVVVSNVDPYDDDPQEILEDIARAAVAAGKSRNKNLFVIEDRREGIRKCLEEAKTGDVVIIACKGAEQSMIIGGDSIPWDDRTVVKEELESLLKLEVCDGLC